MLVALVSELPTSQKQYLWRNYYEAKATFRHAFVQRLLPYLRRRSSPASITLNGVRLESQLHGGDHIRLLLHEYHQEPSSSLHFLVDIRDGSVQQVQRPTDSDTAQREAHLLTKFAHTLSGLSDSDLTRLLYSRFSVD